MAFRTNKTPVLQEKTASGSVASFNTILQKPLVNGEFTIQAYQEGTGDPAPDNVRNIVGFSEVNIYQRGINLWDEQWELGNIDNTTGQPTPSNTLIRSKNYIPVAPNTQYYMTVMGGYQYAYDINKTYIGTFRITNPTPANCYFIKFRLSNDYGTTYKHDISINYPSTDTDYHAYTGNIYTIQLGQEVYGAEVDIVNGVAHIENALVDLGSLTWVASEGFHYAIINNGIYGTNLKAANAICDHYKIVRGQDFASTNNAFCYGLNNRPQLWVNDSNLNSLSASDFKTAISNTFVVYKLAEPFDIQLTPTQIETLIGNNTIFADTGDIDLTYNDLDLAKRGSFREVFKLPS